MWSGKNPSCIAGGEKWPNRSEQELLIKVKMHSPLSLSHSICMYLPRRDGNTSAEEFVHKYSSVSFILVKNNPNAYNHKWLNKRYTHMVKYYLTIRRDR